MSGTPNQPLPDLEDIRASLTVADVLRWAQIEVKARGRGDLYGHQCPREYHRASPRAFCISPSTGMWTCYACVLSDGKPLAGDLLRLIAERQGLTTTGEDFARVKAIAADIAGVTGTQRTPEESARLRAERLAREERDRRQRADEQRRLRASSITKATAYWRRLAERHEPAEQWLAERGVAQAVELGLVRFIANDHGSIAMPLYTSDGQIANVIRRRLPAFAPSPDDRFRPLYKLWGKGTYVSSIADIAPGVDVVLTEGFFDALTAAVAYHDAERPVRAIGARSASDLAMVASAAAPKVKEHGTRLLIAFHRDDAGFGGAIAACREALAAGLRLRDGTLEIVDCGAGDLNEAWCAGWMPWLVADQGDEANAGPHTAAELLRRVRQLEAELEPGAAAGDGPESDRSREASAPVENAPHPADSTDDVDPTPDPDYDLTELGNSDRFVDAYAGALRYVHAWKGWISWDGQRWRRDARGADQEAAKAISRQMRALADAAEGRAARLHLEHAEIFAQASSADRTKEARLARDRARQSSEFREAKRAARDADALRAWAQQSQTARVIGNMAKLACSEPRLVTTPDELDADTWVLNVQNGTLDLRTGELRPHRQADMITRMAGAAYDPDARAPRWEQFLAEVLPDPELRAWLQRWMGYCLTGSAVEQVMLFAYGDGQNGKNVLIEALKLVMGDYAGVAAPDLLMLKNNDEHPTGFADLHGFRLVLVSEIDRGRKWAESTLKRLTGDKTIKARKMKKDFYEFLVTFKFIVAANNRPEVVGTDHGIWRRLRLMLFAAAFTNPDTKLPDKLAAERDGILAWAVQGCLAWQKEGLGYPEAMRKAVGEYRAQQDTVGEWIAERCLCVCAPNAMRWQDDGFCAACGAAVEPHLVGEAREPWSSIYPDFHGWQEMRGERNPWSLKALRAELVKRPGISPYKTKEERGLIGIRLRHRGGATRSNRREQDYKGAGW